ncbi:MAG: anhydro-N-acetylmuramic acid kinase [Holophagaceae bacterium]|nr:anhydro-N-acetylmuramic acid kinase [Holophagaceae bacterium]
MSSEPSQWRIPGLPEQGPWRVLGLMSGTSADGLDAALVEVDPHGFQGGLPFLALLAHHHEPYPMDLREAVVEAAADRLRPSQITVLQRRLGDHHALAARRMADGSGGAPHMASLHGQTIQHHPQDGATLQLADPYSLCEALRCPVVFDLRRMDMALGGQGAPLVTLTELWLRGRAEPWAALNLGGIANITVWDGAYLRAWDVGPGMSLLDLAAGKWLGIPFDPQGAYASGNVDESLLARWMAHPFFSAAPPKSTGRETFGAAWLQMESAPLEALPLPDRLATLAAFTAQSVASELRRLDPLPASLRGLASGGGARHLRLRRELSVRFPELPFADDHQFPNGAREAVSWALLGAASACGLAGNVPEVTGASRAAALGAWVLP